jgi:hypothetical protein
MNILASRVRSFLAKRARKPKVLTPELLPSPSDELSLKPAHSRGCASGNTLAPAKRGITLRADFALNAGSLLLEFWPAFLAKPHYDEKKFWSALSIMAQHEVANAKDG